ncbi:MAG: ATP-grasp domain-containing protein [Planctomycetota bacterium]
MRPVVFVAPFFADATLRFIDAAARLEGARVGLISQDSSAKIPPGLRRHLAAHEQIHDGLDSRQIHDAVRAMAQRLGGCARLLGTLEQLQEPLGLIREALDIPGMRRAAAHNFRDKSQMKDVFRRAGVPCAKYGLAATVAEARAFASDCGFPLVVKPPAGAGARNTMRVNSMEELDQCLRLIPPRPSDPVMLEEFVIGSEHSFDTVSLNGRHIWHSLTHYTPGPLAVMENPWIQWTVLLPREVDHPRYDDIRSVAVRALDSLGMGTGLTHMEWFRRPDGSLAISEVAARPPGAQFTTLISHAHGIDFYRAWARLMIFDAFDPPPRRYAAGIAFLRGQGRGRVKAVHGLDEAQEEMSGLVAEVQLPHEGQPRANGYEGEGFVVLRHPETAVVERALARVVQLVQVELSE